jgi:hypothetical protein
MTDPELERIVRHSTEQAEAMYPKRALSIKAKIALFISGFLIVGNSVLGIVDTAILSQQGACKKQADTQLAVVRNQDQHVVDQWVNNVTDQILAGKITVGQLDQIRNEYNANRKSNDEARAKLTATSCK